MAPTPEEIASSGVPVEVDPQKEALDNMMEWFEPGKPSEVAPVVDPVIAAVEDKIPNDPAVPIAPSAEVVPPVVPVAPVVPEVPAMKTDLELLQEQLAASQAEITRLAGMVATGGVPQIYPATPSAVPAVPVTPVTPATPVAPTVPEEKVPNIFETLLTPKEYLSKEDLDKVIDKPELINQAIHKSRTEMVETFASAIPTLVNMAVNRQMMINKAVTSFYEINTDLLPHSQYVQMMMGEVERANPTKTYNEIFQLTADESRKRLGLKLPTPTTPVVPVGQPATPGGPAFGGQKGGASAPITPGGGKQDWFDSGAEGMLDDFRPK